MPEQAAVSTVSLSALPAASRRQCKGCNPGLFRRVNRASLLERTLLTWLGFYPWECVSCRRRRLFRDQGRRPASPKS